MPTSTCRDSDHTDELLLYILLAIIGMLGPYVLLWMLFHPIRTAKILMALTVLMAVLAGVVAAFVFLGWWAVPLLGVLFAGLLALDRPTRAGMTAGSEVPARFTID
jgi:hypothetical protein